MDVYHTYINQEKDISKRKIKTIRPQCSPPTQILFNLLTKLFIEYLDEILAYFQAQNGHVVLQRKGKQTPLLKYWLFGHDKQQSSLKFVINFKQVKGVTSECR